MIKRVRCDILKTSTSLSIWLEYIKLNVTSIVIPLLAPFIKRLFTVELIKLCSSTRKANISSFSARIFIITFLSCQILGQIRGSGFSFLTTHTCITKKLIRICRLILPMVLFNFVPKASKWKPKVQTKQKRSFTGLELSRY